MNMSAPKSLPPAGHPSGSEQPQASGEPTPPNLQSQFNASGGSQHNNTSDGNQYISHGNMTISQTCGSHEPPKPLRDCLRSLAFPQMQNRSHDIGPAVKGTCEWLLQHETYLSWAACDRGLLWIKGKPGSGKSTLLKHALNNRMEVPGARDSDLVLSFFFHGRGDGLQKSPLGLFRSLLHQVLNQAPDALPDLVDTSEKKRQEFGEPGEKWQWHQEELWPFLESSLPRVLKTCSVWLFVDALDECGKENAVDLVDKFKSLLQSIPSIGLQFRICFTCRHYPILDLDGVFEICTERENSDDISSYVRNQLSTFSKRTSSTIPDLITAHAQGVFMWARLVVKQVLDLDREGEGPGAIEAAIHSIPPDLDELYRTLLRSMKPDSLKLIQWICFAMRPLSVAELPWAMAVDPDGAHKSLDECQDAKDYVSDSDRMKRRVQTLSCGLAEVTPSSQTQVVQFIHQSVKDFFVDKGLSALDSSLISTDAVGIAHHRLSKICIRYLAIKEIGQSTSYGRRDFPFLHYATTSWVAHARQSDARNARQEDLLECFGWPPDAFVELWVRVYGILGKYSKGCPAEKTSLIHVTSRYQVLGLLRIILQRADQVGIDIGVDSKDEDGRTPLWWAAARGHEAVVKLLLEKVAGVDSKDWWGGQTPLSRAAAGGHEAVVKLLLEKGAGVDLKDCYGRTPLWWAAAGGHKAVVKLLLEKGAGVNLKGRHDGRTPLWWAAARGHEAVVKLLLEKGAGIDSKDWGDQTPLSWAAARGHEAVVKLLLEKGAGFDSRDWWVYWTPLSRA